MDNQKLSGGFARMAQLMLLLFFLPFISFLFYITLIKNFLVEGCVFFMIFIAVIFFIIRHGFSYADLYISSRFLIVKKLFSTRSKSRGELKQIESAFLPFTFYLKFEDSTKVFFFSDNSDLFKQLISSDSDKGVKIIKEKLSKHDF